MFSKIDVIFDCSDDIATFCYLWYENQWSTDFSHEQGNGKAFTACLILVTI